MARTVAAIQKQILDQIAADPVLSVGLTSQSRRAIYRLLSYVMAVCIAVFEQLQDQFLVDAEAIADAAPPASGPWVRQKMFEFQYSEDVPQVVQLIDLVPQYPIPDATLRIITRCSVTSTLNNTVNVKVAKSEVPEALTVDEKAAAQSYINTIGAAGVTYAVISLPADRLYLNAQVYYTGLYSPTIKANVYAAIDSYLASLPFDGAVLVSRLQDAIQAVTGVRDVIIQDARARAQATAFANATALVSNFTQQARQWRTVAGYIIGEDTSGETFQDTINFIPQ